MSSQSLSSLTSYIYKSRKNILELMEKQGYNINDYSNFSINEVNSMKQNNQLDMLLEKTEENPITKRKNKIYISYYLTKMIRPSNIQEMIDDLFNLEEVLTKEDTLFIIIKDEIPTLSFWVPFFSLLFSFVFHFILNPNKNFYF